MNYHVIKDDGTTRTLMLETTDKAIANTVKLVLQHHHKNQAVSMEIVTPKAELASVIELFNNTDYVASLKAEFIECGLQDSVLYPCVVGGRVEYMYFIACLHNGDYTVYDHNSCYVSGFHPSKADIVKGITNGFARFDS